MWYVIQTITGKEEELMSMIGTVLDGDLYTDCFVMEAEWMKRLGGKWEMQLRPMFPGYVFIDTKEPERLFQELKGVPMFSKILGSGQFEFTPVTPEETVLLKLLTKREDGPQRIVCLSEVRIDEQGRRSIKGALQYFEDSILKIETHKRYAAIKIHILGKERTLILGIKLEKDE